MCHFGPRMHTTVNLPLLLLLLSLTSVIDFVGSGCPCGQLNGHSTRDADQVRIVGGVLSKGNSWPWVAALVQQDESGPTQYCGSSILNSLYILTAAHCVFDIKQLGDQFVYIGDHKINGSRITKYGVQSVRMHPQFKHQTLDNDVALIRLTSPIANPQPICLPRKAAGDSEVGQRAFVVGWGSTKNNGPTVNAQRQVQVQIVPRNTCRRSYARDGISVTPNMVCATAMKKDSCAGDSGGPLFVKARNGQHYEQVGIVSFGKSCALRNFPGIYTNLHKYVSWIEQNTKDAGKC